MQTIYDTKKEGLVSEIYLTPGAASTDYLAHKIAYDYDDLLRVQSKTEFINGQDYIYSYQYDDLGRTKYMTYPTGLKIRNKYNSKGFLKEILDANTTKSIWKINADGYDKQVLQIISTDVYFRFYFFFIGNSKKSSIAIAMVYFLNEIEREKSAKILMRIYDLMHKGRLVGYSVNNNDNKAISTIKEYDEQTGLLTHIDTYSNNQQVQDLHYTYDILGNMNSRSQTTASGIALHEAFNYDELSRLIDVTTRVNGSINNTIDYDYADNGNIENISSVGSFSYAETQNAGPYAISGVDFNLALGETTQNISYTAFDKIKQLSHINGNGILNGKIEISYGLDQQRLYQITTLENGTTKEKYFIGGLYEKEISEGNTKELCYISTPAGTVAIKQTENNNDTWLFLTHDHLGSVHCILNEEGRLEQELSFDPYGNRRDPNTWKPFEEGLEPTYILDRGYTFHEHWDDFDLINMNGRVYDPIIARFLSPDPYVQSPGYSQNFNRYSYVLNNPLRYTDPSGEIIWFAPIIIGAVIGGSIGALRAEINGMEWYDGLWRGAAVGAVGGALSLVGGAGMSFAANLALGTVEGAATGALDAAFWGNDIGKGAMYGAIGGAVFTTLTSPNFSNWTKGEKFLTNEKVFNNMMDRGMDKQGMLDYFGFEGKFNPNITSKQYEASDYWGSTSSKTGKKSYGNLAFQDYATLKGTYIKESFHSQKILNDIPLEKLPEDLQGLGMDTYLEEIDGYMHMYKNQGLFKGHNMPMKGVEFYQTQLRGFGVSYPSYPNRFQWIYQIPRRW